MSSPEVTVRGTPEAVEAVAALGTLVGGPLSRSLETVRRHAVVLADPENWDGRAAGEFRTTLWPAYERAMVDLQLRLDRLRARLAEIQADIANAG